MRKITPRAEAPCLLHVASSGFGCIQTSCTWREDPGMYSASGTSWPAACESRRPDTFSTHDIPQRLPGFAREKYLTTLANMSPAMKIPEPNLDISFQGKLPEILINNVMID
jgi:hypothetical protein